MSASPIFSPFIPPPPDSPLDCELCAAGDSVDSIPIAELSLLDKTLQLTAEPEDVRHELAEKVAKYFSASLRAMNIPYEWENLSGLVEHLMVRSGMGRAAVFAALYLLWRLRNLPRFEWQSDPDAAYLFTAVVFMLAEKQREDNPYENCSWLVMFNNFLEKVGLFRPEAAHTAVELTCIEVELLQYLDYNLDVMFALPIFQEFKRALKSDTLSLLKVSFPEDLPASSLPDLPCPFPVSPPRRNPPANRTNDCSCTSVRQAPHILLYSLSLDPYYSHPTLPVSLPSPESSYASSSSSSAFSSSSSSCTGSHVIIVSTAIPWEPTKIYQS
ncbi:uncharacterized protein STEHIDRAFT_114398 [Stereum hirsutum FP-91666 SS1]|uniref:uncharacterized protein n=1 Tax=Stereum hirsutum (strain FP-91666) TaxID=721885 RepID=UPI000444A6D1|nr:uncharacterized protein STEHIDRAFT_114398 [Stereum hirsutum FP-91666 SS1]EIM82497.1 hypothetical protein STEHIDRAFT_114398 [Stereum hirsutum FP-91666 SS1]